MRRAAALFVAIASASCGGPAPEKPLTAQEQRRAVLDQIADKCGLPRTVFELIGGDELLLKPESTASYEGVDCALRELKVSKFQFKLGFVGNEAYVGKAE